MTKTVMQTAVCIAIILTNNFAEAADWILHPQRKGRQIKDDVEYEEVVEAVRAHYYSLTAFERESLATMACPPCPVGVVNTAQRWAAEVRLRQYCRQANVEFGIPVLTRDLIDRYNTIVAEGPYTDRLAPIPQIDTIKGRVWATRWRKNHGACIRALRAEEPVSIDEKRYQAKCNGLRNSVMNKTSSPTMFFFTFLCNVYMH